MVTEPKLSIIIISYNSLEVTRECLQSVYGSDMRSEYEVIVVDNASGDGSPEMVSREFPQARLIANAENLFFAKANNQGAAIARGKYLLLLNSDTIVRGDNLQRMVDFYEGQPEDVACIGPRILNPDGTLQSCGYPDAGNTFQHTATVFLLHRLLPLRLLSAPLDRRPRSTHRTGWVSGCCMMISRKIYIEEGGLCEDLRFYGEEPEFSYRTRKKGYRTIYFGGAEITHLGGYSTTKSEGKRPDLDNDDYWRWYDVLVERTFGLRKALRLNRITLWSMKLWKLLGRGGRSLDTGMDRQQAQLRHIRRMLAKKGNRAGN